jgi:hypothetical protein
VVDRVFKPLIGQLAFDEKHQPAGCVNLNGQILQRRFHCKIHIVCHELCYKFQGVTTSEDIIIRGEYYDAVEEKNGGGMNTN